MHNTPSPLSISFLDATGRIFSIQDMQPNSDDFHFSGEPAQEALELNQGRFAELGIKVGTRLVSRNCRVR